MLFMLQDKCSGNCVTAVQSYGEKFTFIFKTPSRVIIGNIRTLYFAIVHDVFCVIMQSNNDSIYVYYLCNGWQFTNAAAQHGWGGLSCCSMLLEFRKWLTGKLNSDETDGRR